MIEKSKQPGFMRLPEVLNLYPVSKSTLWNMVKEGNFPKPYPITNNRMRAWKRSEVMSFLDSIQTTKTTTKE